MFGSKFPSLFVRLKGFGALKFVLASSHSPLTLSSDSGSSLGGGSWNEDKTDDEGSSPKSFRFLKVPEQEKDTRSYES
ncbi:hypothetical protein JHK87_050146 [Glycine soja]|nr:hypothetical protein JHK87_050146 [Glycine soja]